jgi:cytochrome c556
MNKKMLISICFCLAVIPAVWAHGGATGIVKQRMDGMMTMGKSLAVIADMFKGKRNYEPRLILQSADELKKHAVEIAALFPDTETSRNGKGTEALPEIWSRNDDFLAIAAQLTNGADDLKNIARVGTLEDVRQVFGKIAKTCSSCHRDFRKSKH